MNKTLKAQKGIAFKPRENEKMIATGWVNQSHEEIGQFSGEKVIITRSENNGEQYHDIFIHAGKLYKSKPHNEYKLDGSLLDKKLFIYFNVAQSGADYMGLSLLDRTEDQQEQIVNNEQTENQQEQIVNNEQTENSEANEKELADDIPF
jgi:hypothetical protein